MMMISGWQYKRFARVAGSPPHGTLVDPRTGVYRPGMCKLFSRPYPTAVSGDLISFNFNWTSSELHIKASPPPSGDSEIVVAVTEEDEWGWEGNWYLKSISNVSGERIGIRKVDDENELENPMKGVRWWVEKSYVEGSKLVKIRLGTDWNGPADAIIGLSGVKVLEEDHLFDQHWDLNSDHILNKTQPWLDWSLNH